MINAFAVTDVKWTGVAGMEGVAAMVDVVSEGLCVLGDMSWVLLVSY